MNVFGQVLVKPSPTGGIVRAKNHCKISLLKDFSDTFVTLEFGWLLVDRQKNSMVKCRVNIFTIKPVTFVPVPVIFF